VDCANRLPVDRLQRDDPNRITMLVGAQGVARTVEARPGFLSNVARHLKCAARIEIQSRGVDGRALARTNHRARPLGSDPAISDLDFANASMCAIIQQNFPCLRLGIAFNPGHGNNVIHGVAIRVNAYDSEGVIGGDAFLGESRRDQNLDRDQRPPHARN